MKTFTLAFLVVVFVLAACGDDDTEAATTTSAATTAAPVTTTMTAPPTTTSTMPLSEDERIAAAGAVVDGWNQGWNDSDPDVVVSVFTDDAIHITWDGATQTMDGLRYDVSGRGFYITNAVRVGECTPVGDNTYTCEGEFDAHGYTYATAVEIELEGDLAVRLEFLGLPVEIGLASAAAPCALDVTFESTLDSLGTSPDPVGTFLAMGPAVDEGVMCPEGTLEDREGRRLAGGITGRPKVTFVCADGSGEFLVGYGSYHSEDVDGVYTESGTWTIGRNQETVGGWTPSPDATGAYENLVGAGYDTTTEVDDIPVIVSTGQVALVSG